MYPFTPFMGVVADSFYEKHCAQLNRGADASLWRTGRRSNLEWQRLN
jgi:hypothetical protein